MISPQINGLPRLFLIRHSDTDWTDSHQHTGHTNIRLNARGEVFARVWGSTRIAVMSRHIAVDKLFRASFLTQVLIESLTTDAQLPGNLRFPFTGRDAET